jgi:hypothetical protein
MVGPEWLTIVFENVRVDVAGATVMGKVRRKNDDQPLTAGRLGSPEGATMEVGMPLEQFLITMAGIIGAVITLRGPLGRALAARIEGRRAPDHETQLELEDLRARVAALEEGHAQLAELQDRVEFAERLHSREHQPRPGLPG